MTNKNSSQLVSLIVVASDGGVINSQTLATVTEFLSKKFEFFELIVVATVGGEALKQLSRSLDTSIGHVRLLGIDGNADFDRLAVYGCLACIGDFVILTSIEELGLKDVDTILTGLLRGESVVRLRRRQNTVIERLASSIVRTITGLHVDTRFCKSIGMNRQTLSQLLGQPEDLHLFRFTAFGEGSGQLIAETDSPPQKVSLSQLGRRADLVARLVGNSSARLLRVASILSLLLALAALLALLYAVALWMLKRDLVEGWTTTISLMAVWMFVQMSATAVICLGVSRLIERQDRAKSTKVAEEITTGDLFNRADMLNVENFDDAI